MSRKRSSTSRAAASRTASRATTPQFDLPEGPVRGQHALLECHLDDRGVLLYVDGVESSYLDADPAHLEFEYMQQMTAALRAARGEGPVRALHLGGGGCALARAWDARFPGSAQVAVEYDSVLAANARQWFDLPRSPRLRVRHGEARAVLTEGSARFEAITRDVFVGRDVPAHLRTAEFVQAVRSRLEEGGLYLANLGARPPLTEARREVATALEVWGRPESTALISLPALLAGRRYGNFVLAFAPDVCWERSELTRLLLRLPLPAAFISGEKLVAFAAGNEPYRD
ncbi:spermidine synthase [Buchananella felis]|uniref:spermidine synthase n=1 Tax=Buchananella felis TaxID=3231492 RepID=UPI00352935DC